MSIIRIGTTKKYADGWDAIFGNKSKRSGTSKPRAASSQPKKKAASRKRK